MSTFGAFQSSVLGMVSQSHALGVIGANIANVATSGFKRTDAHFETLLGRSFASQPGTPDLGGPLTSQSGLGGVAAKDYARVSLQGELAASGGDYDVAINGPGFFVFEDGPVGSGRRVYGRDGAFASRVGAPLTAQLSDGTTAAGTETYLVDGSGRYVLGWPAAGGSAAPAANAGGLGPIRMDPYAFITPFAPTSAVGLGLNLPALAAEGSREAYSIDVFDSAGRAQPIQLGFTKTGINAWALDAVGAPGDALTLGPAPLAPLSFDAMGRVAGGAPYAISVTHPGGASVVCPRWPRSRRPRHHRLRRRRHRPGHLYQRPHPPALPAGPGRLRQSRRAHRAQRQRLCRKRGFRRACAGRRRRSGLGFAGSRRVGALQRRSAARVHQDAGDAEGLQRLGDGVSHHRRDDHHRPRPEAVTGRRAGSTLRRTVFSLRSGA
ncbi:MAG: flagellar hook-basal body complex protein [Rhodospirillales bacterium]|nr:flagellar hook-basal body complex protein [Rhodospirillales bacterium]